jgi:hypothetical protein
MNVEVIRRKFMSKSTLHCTRIQRSCPRPMGFAGKQLYSRRLRPLMLYVAQHWSVGYSLLIETSPVAKRTTGRSREMLGVLS